MPISFACPKCNAVISTPDKNAGKKGKCPGCGEDVRIPGQAGPPPDPEAVQTMDASGKPIFEVLGDNIRILGEPNPEDPGFVEAFTAVVQEIGSRGVPRVKIDFSQSEFRNKDRTPIVGLAKKTLRPYKAELQICLTGLFK